MLDGQGFTASGAEAWAWHDGSLVAVARMISGTAETEAAIVLDDAQSVVEMGIKASWQMWLHLSNLLGLRESGSAIMVRSLVSGGSTPPSVTMVAAGNGAQLHAGWEEVRVQATVEEGPFLAQLAHDGIPVPEYGPEVEGIPLGPSWLDRKITVDVDLGDTERSELVALGWTIVSMDLDDVRSALEVGDS